MQWLPAPLLLFLFFAAPALAGQVSNPAGRFAIWMPDQWVVEVRGNRVIAHNPLDTIQVVAGPLADADSDLVDEDVLDFVDDQIDDMGVSVDRMTTHAGKPARRLEGNGEDEDEDIVFRAIAIDVAANFPVIEALVYGETDPMGRPEVQTLIERILASFRPL